MRPCFPLRLWLAAGLIEDNSPCRFNHTETDLNTWHDYLAGYEWCDVLNRVDKETYAGSTWNFTADIPSTRRSCSP
jgi:hypothetical protein